MAQASKGETQCNINSLCLPVSEFPGQSGNEVQEFRKSRAAVIASEPIQETLEISHTRIKKTVS